MKIRCYLLLAAAFAAGLARPAAAAELLGIVSDGGRDTITLTIPDATGRKVFTVEHPDRLVADIPALHGHPGVSLPGSYDGRLIKSVRIGRFDAKTSRIVFDLASAVRVAKLDTEEKDGEVRLIITIAAAEKAQEAPAEQVKPKETAKEPAKKAVPEKLAPKPKKPKKPLIVIDPGHGGVDPGTIGPNGSQEKDVVLAYAKALKAKLLKNNRYRVMLTRSNDNFIRLRQRVAIARKAGADLFISLHADSEPEMDVRGLSVYTLSEKSSDQEAEALAARENKADVLAGVDLSDEREDVAGILISLAQRETKNDSATFADFLVRNLDGKVRLLSNSHRFAGFAVLKAPDVPSVLVETGFLSHPQEEKLLTSKAYREKVVTGIAAGVDAYFRQMKRIP